MVVKLSGSSGKAILSQVKSSNFSGVRSTPSAPSSPARSSYTPSYNTPVSAPAANVKALNTSPQAVSKVQAAAVSPVNVQASAIANVQAVTKSVSSIPAAKVTLSNVAKSAAPKMVSNAPSNLEFASVSDMSVELSDNVKKTIASYQNANIANAVKVGTVKGNISASQVDVELSDRANAAISRSLASAVKSIPIANPSQVTMEPSDASKQAISKLSVASVDKIQAVSSEVSAKVPESKLKIMSVGTEGATAAAKVGTVSMDTEFAKVSDLQNVKFARTDALKAADTDRLQFASSTEKNVQASAVSDTPVLSASELYSEHPAQYANQLLDSSLESDYLSCVDPTGFEWTMPSGKVGPNYVDAFGNQMSREEYIATYNVDPEYAYQYMRTNQAANELAAIQATRGGSVAQLSGLKAIPSGVGSVATVSPTRSYQYASLSNAEATAQAVDSYASSGYGLGYGNDYESVEQSAESQTDEEQIRAYLASFKNSSGLVDIEKLKTNDYSFYTALVTYGLISASAKTAEYETLVTGVMRALNSTSDTNTDTDTTNTDTTDTDTDNTDTDTDTDSDETVTSHTLVDNLVTEVTTPVVVETNEPRVVVPKNSLYINNKGYEIPTAGLDVATILADAKVLVSDREKRKNFESVITAIAGENGKLDLAEVSKLQSIAGIPVRFG